MYKPEGLPKQWNTVSEQIVTLQFEPGAHQRSSSGPIHLKIHTVFQVMSHDADACTRSCDQKV